MVKPFYIPTSSLRVSISRHHLLTLTIHTLVDGKSYLTGVLMCISLMVNDAGNFPVFSFVTHTSLLVDGLFKSFAYFFLHWVFVADCRLSCPEACELVPQPGIKPMCPALEGGFLTTGPPGKSLYCLFLSWVCVLLLMSCGSGGGASGKEPTCQGKRHNPRGFDPWVGKISRSRKWQPTSVFLPGESHGQRSLAGYSSWGRTESDMTEAT